MSFVVTCAAQFHEEARGSLMEWAKQEGLPYELRRAKLNQLKAELAAGFGEPAGAVFYEDRWIWERRLTWLSYTYRDAPITICGVSIPFLQHRTVLVIGVYSVNGRDEESGSLVHRTENLRDLAQQDSPV